MEGRGVVLIIVGLGLILLLPAASAEEEPPQPSPENNTLWAHASDWAGCCEMWMNPLQYDSRAVEVNPGYGGPDDTQVQWQMTLKPVLNRTLILDENETAYFAVHIGGLEQAGTVEVRVQFAHDGHVLARSDWQEITYIPVPSEEEYPLVEWELPLEADEMEPGLTVWSIMARGLRTGAYLSTEEATGRTYLQLPIIDTIEHESRYGEFYGGNPIPGPPMALVFLAIASFVVHRARQNLSTKR